jgi:DNA-binding transcriptional regulator WhiA
MKKLFIMLSLLVSASTEYSFAQTGSSQQVDTIQRTQLMQLLDHYFSIKDALVAGNGTLASNSSAEFIKTINTIDYKVISEGNVNALLKDATSISETKDINKQRGHFANLSDNMIALAKTLKMGDEVIYIQYCPMKKANWLSNNKTIKNPYYGNAMLTCGSITETINQ